MAITRRSYQYGREFLRTSEAGIHGIYHNVSRQYLQPYIWQADFLWNNRKLNDGERIMSAVDQPKASASAIFQRTSEEGEKAEKKYRRQKGYGKTWAEARRIEIAGRLARTNEAVSGKEEAEGRLAQLELDDFLERD